MESETATAERVAQAAAALSGALDRSDFASAERLLAPDCLYEVRGHRVAGAPAIIASYAETHEWAVRNLDEVRYESRVEAVSGTVATVLYTDYLLKVAGGWLRHRCRQHLTVAADGRIARIVHEDLPGEVEALDDYFRRCGISR